VVGPRGSGPHVRAPPGGVCRLRRSRKGSGPHAYNHGFGLIDEEELSEGDVQPVRWGRHNRAIGQLMVMLPRLWSTVRSAMC